MALHQTPLYPAAGGYVLRLHRDSRPADGLLKGRVEHVASCNTAEFASVEELVAWLVRHAAEKSDTCADGAEGTP